MVKPAVWHDDPECGHAVACQYQTHYCTYIRVPRLLTLQSIKTPDEILLVTSLQWLELWFKVLLTDLRSIPKDSQATLQLPKVLHRGIELFKLFDLELAFAESAIIRELRLKKSLRQPRNQTFSSQLAQIERLSLRLTRLARNWPSSNAAREYLALLRAFQARYAKFLRAALVSRTKAGQTFANWLCLDELLDLQQGVKAGWAPAGQNPSTAEPPASITADENMFIVVHQCFELWFKVILDHIDRAIPLISKDEIGDANYLLRRVVEIMRLLVQQIEIPATMLPLDFARFRSEEITRDGITLRRGLSPASGTESYQFREIEIVAGLRDDAVFRNYLQGNEKLPIRLQTPRQTERLSQPTLVDAFHNAVKRRGVERLDALFTSSDEPNANADLAVLGDTLIEFDEAFRFWRLAHVSMVEKMIGAKSGTGFLGPEYLMETAGYRVQAKNRIFAETQVRPRFFEELWQVRTRMGAH